MPGVLFFCNYNVEGEMKKDYNIRNEKKKFFNSYVRFSEKNGFILIEALSDILTGEKYGSIIPCID